MPSTGENWVCPYCGHAQVISEELCDDWWRGVQVDDKKSALGPTAFHVLAIVCANRECSKLSLECGLASRRDNPPNNRFSVTQTINAWRLLPSSFAKPQPEFIPESLRRDYEEACAIRDLSPKASATITRRCIQGIIRDFCGITKGRLIDEIRELRRRVDAGQAPAGVQADTVTAIDHVRTIGNIGAHMEGDINLIVDVDPDEAQILIGLTEILFVEWYVSRDTRARRLQQLGVIAVEKQQQRQPPPPRSEGEAEVPDVVSEVSNPKDV
jgi:hypothetical protein